MLLPFLTPFLLLAPVLSSGLLVGLLLCQLIPLHFGSPDYYMLSTGDTKAADVVSSLRKLRVQYRGQTWSPH